MRSESDVPLTMALLAGGADIFVTNDRDFTDPDSTAERFRGQVSVMLAAVFLRDVLGGRPRRWKPCGTAPGRMSAGALPRPIASIREGRQAGDRPALSCLAQTLHPPEAITRRRLTVAGHDLT